MSGVTSAGFVPKTQLEIQQDMETSEHGSMDPAADVSPTAPLGQLNGIISAQIAPLWALGQVAYNAVNPNADEGFLLDAVCSITGTKRLAATKSLAKNVVVNLNSATTLPAGSLLNVSGNPSFVFQSKTAVTSTTAGPYVVDFEALNTGPIVANANTLNVITAPVLGWNSAHNPTDAILGTDTEKDAPLRIRRVIELSKAGGSTVEAIRADLLDIPGILQAFVFENVTDFYDVNGLPPHSIKPIIYDGPSPTVANQTIWDVVRQSKGGGIQVVGDITGTSIGPDGVAYQVAFSRPVVRNVYLAYDISATDGLYTGDQNVKDAVKAAGDAYLNLGIDVIASRFRAVPLTILGVWDVTGFRLDFSPSPSNTANLVIGPFELARFDTSRITLNVTSAPQP